MFSTLPAKEATRVFLNHPEDQKVDSDLNENDGFFPRSFRAAYMESKQIGVKPPSSLYNYFIKWNGEWWPCDSSFED